MHFISSSQDASVGVRLTLHKACMLVTLLVKRFDRISNKTDLRFVNAQLQSDHLAKFWQACVDWVWIGDIVCNLLFPMLLVM